MINDDWVSFIYTFIYTFDIVKGNDRITFEHSKMFLIHVACQQFKNRRKYNNSENVCLIIS